jgi:predicted phage terminase large subunit-like protein
MALEAAGNGLVINMPPRMGKTEMAVILWMSYTFARNPRARFIHVSSGEDLALKNSSAVKEILQSPEFIEMFPDCVIKSDTSAKKLWETTKGGGVKAGAAGGAVTGFGAGRMGWIEGDLFDGAVIIDDPLKIRDATSEPLRTAVNANFSHTLRSRRNHPKVPVLLIMQRIHADDASEYCLSGKMAIPFEHLCLKALQDDGTALWPEKMSLEEMELMKLMDRFTFAGQFQQSPIAAGGNVIQLDWFKRYVRCPEGRVIHSWDTAYKVGDHNDPSCCMVWVVASGVYYLKDVIHGKFEYPELLRKITETADRYPPDVILIEDKASGQSLLQQFQGKLPVVAIQPVGDKETRLRSTSGAVESGMVHFPEEAHWLSETEHELTAFPNAKYKDRADAFSQFLNYIKDNGSSYADLMREMGYDV